MRRRSFLQRREYSAEIDGFHLRLLTRPLQMENATMGDDKELDFSDVATLLVDKQKGKVERG